jgi:hypothetical protein
MPRTKNPPNPPICERAGFVKILDSDGTKHLIRASAVIDIVEYGASCGLIRCANGYEVSTVEPPIVTLYRIIAATKPKPKAV